MAVILDPIGCYFPGRNQQASNVRACFDDQVRATQDRRQERFDGAATGVCIKSSS
jgi:hypothetical protein